MRILPDTTASADGGALVSFIDISPMVAFERHLRDFNEGADTMLRMVLQIADATLAQAAAGQSGAAMSQTETGMSRLRSLGAIYKLLSRVEWHPVALRDLFTVEIEELGPSYAARVSLDGPEVSLKPKAAIVIGLALHELVGNARRHGALSETRGRAHLNWSIQAANGGDAQLTVTWRESGGPTIAPPETAGFGRAMFDHQLRREIGAEASLNFPQDGAEASIALPLSGNMALDDC
jgi:two-component sensor histidine kinase